LAAKCAGSTHAYKIILPDSLVDAEKTAVGLGVQMDTIDITPMIEPIILHDPQMSNLRKGNMMARARIDRLIRSSEAFRGLVVGTSNKTEILLVTRRCGAIWPPRSIPIGDLYKTQLRQLVHFFDM